MEAIHKIKGYKNTLKYSIANSLEIIRMNMLKKINLRDYVAKITFFIE